MPGGSVAPRTARAALLVVVAFASCTSTPDTRVDEPIATPRARRPSQSSADASRDGVPAALAALPFRQRVRAEVTVSSDNEVWIASRPRIAGMTEYGEIVKVDKRKPRRILRAYPFRGAPPQRLVLREDALYCGRAGDGGLPDSMVCRIDRETLDITVRVYPHDRSAADYPDTWSIGDGYLEMRDLDVTEDGVWSQSFDGTWTRLDPSTLRIVDSGARSPSASS